MIGDSSYQIVDERTDRQPDDLTFTTHPHGMGRLGWSSRLAPEPEHQAEVRPVPGLKVLVIGEVVLEHTIEIESTKSQVMASLEGRIPDEQLRWRRSRIQLGGFVANVVRAARAVGAEVSVCTIVPHPTPRLWEDFLEQHDVRERFVTPVPGSWPMTIRLCCADGIVCIRRSSILNTSRLVLPSAAAMNFDAVLADPRRFVDSIAVVRRLFHWFDRDERPFTVALRIDRRWSRSCPAPRRYGRLWAFLRCRDARRLAAEVAATRTGMTTRPSRASIVRAWQTQCNLPRLVVQLGPRGALLLNGLPRPYHAPACPIDNVGRVAGGDTLLTITTLSSAAGTDDKTSLRRGVEAATGQVAGLGLPQSLEELDVS